MIAQPDTLDLDLALKLLSDPLRLRILALLSLEELSVGELVRSLDVSQSRTSNHLRLLRDAGLLAERHVGTSTYLRLVPESDGAPTARRLFSGLTEELDRLANRDADLVRLERVRAERTDRSFFDRAAGQWDKVMGRFLRGIARERAALYLVGRGGRRFADLGCGTGTMSESLLGIADELILVDQSEAMLTEARARFRARERGTETSFLEGSLGELPLEDASVDGVLCGMVLHHLPTLDRALAEMRRVLAPGGRAVVVELAPHKEAWMREAQGDRHLGLAPDDVRAAFERVGFQELVIEPLDDAYLPQRPDGTEPPALSLYLVRGTAR